MVTVLSIERMVEVVICMTAVLDVCGFTKLDKPEVSDQSKGINHEEGKLNITGDQ